MSKQNPPAGMAGTSASKATDGKPVKRPPAAGRHGTGTFAERKRPSMEKGSRRTRGRTIGILAAIVVVLVGVVVAVLAVTASPGRSPSSGLPVVTGPMGPENVPIEQGNVLASAASAAGGEPVSGVECNSSEQLAFHVHTHLSVYVDGVLRPIPAGIGIVAPLEQQTASGVFDSASHCYYWLHVHAQDGIIHIESPAGHAYVLGQFFDLWGQPLGAGRVGPATGPLTMWVDGRVYRGDPRSIPLGSHEDVQIDVGRPVVGPHALDWSAASL